MKKKVIRGLIIIIIFILISLTYLNHNSKNTSLSEDEALITGQELYTKQPIYLMIGTITFLIVAMILRALAMMGNTIYLFITPNIVKQTFPILMN